MLEARGRKWHIPKADFRRVEDDTSLERMINSNQSGSLLIDVHVWLSTARRRKDDAAALQNIFDLGRGERDSSLPSMLQKYSHRAIDISRRQALALVRPVS